MNILIFGHSGRLAKICRTAAQIAFPNSKRFTLKRDMTFRDHENRSTYASIADIMADHPGRGFLVMDASVDHRSKEDLIAHEAIKRKYILWLERNNLLRLCVGFSSGITDITPKRIKCHAAHMIEYREQKIAQEDLFNSLECSAFLPKLYTIVGPYTYSSQKAAWAQVLRARAKRTNAPVLNEPFVRKAWAAELEVLHQLVVFLQADYPTRVFSSIVQGEFTLDEIARSQILPLPPLRYETGDSPGWLDGHYIPNTSPSSPLPIGQELLRSLMLND